MSAVAHGSAPQVVVFDPYASGTLDASSCATFGARYPSAALFAYGDFADQPVHDVLRLVRAGVRGVATRGQDDDPAVFRLLLVDALLYSVVGEVLAALEDRLAPDLLRLMRFLLENVREPISPREAARFLHRDQKTLRRHLKDAGLPPTAELIAWTRLFHAAALLGDPARTVENVAFVLDFPSANALRNQLRRYVRISPTELRMQDGLAYILSEFWATYTC